MILFAPFVIPRCTTTRYINTSKVENYDATVGGTIDYYSRPYKFIPCDGGAANCDPSGTVCGGENEIPCGPWPLLSDRLQVSGWNTYEATNEPAPRNMCNIVGIKPVMAKLNWYGRESFVQPCGTPGTTRYCSVEIEAYETAVGEFCVDDGGLESPNADRSMLYHGHRKFTVDQTSGVNKLTGYAEDWHVATSEDPAPPTSDQGHDPLPWTPCTASLYPICTVYPEYKQYGASCEYTPRFDYDEVKYRIAQIVGVCGGGLVDVSDGIDGVNKTDGTLDPQGDARAIQTEDGPGGQDGIMDVITNEISVDGTTYTMIYNYYSLVGRTNPAYPDTSADRFLYQYLFTGGVSIVVTLGDAYTLASFNAAVDSMLDAVPLNDDTLIPWSNTDTPIICPLVTKVQVQGRAAPFDSMELGEGWTDPLEGCYHGTTVGIPKPGGYDSYFAPDYPVAGCCPDTWGFPQWYIASAGAFSTAYPVPVNATYWTETNAQLEQLPAVGGWQWFNGTTKIKCKMAMRVGYVKAQNLGRPAGWQDRYSIDEDRAACVRSVAGMVVTTDNEIAGGLTGEPCYVAADGISAGVYSVTGSVNTYTVGAYLYAMPPGITVQTGPGGAIAPLRFPTCWPILGKASATAVLFGGYVTVTTADNLYLRSGDLIELVGTSVHGSILVTGANTFTLAGSSLDGFTGQICAYGAPLAFTNDTRRGTAVYVHNTATDPAREQVTYDVTQCNAVLAITDTATDTWPNAVVRPIPSFVGAFGTVQLGLGMFYPYMLDLLQQIPHKDCIEHLSGAFGQSACEYRQDDGTCKSDTCGFTEYDGESGFRFFPPILREAMLTMPAGAPTPAVPIDPASYTLPGNVVLNCSGPIPLPYPPWKLYNSMRLATCEGSGCRFSETYSAEGARCF